MILQIREDAVELIVGIIQQLLSIGLVLDCELDNLACESELTYTLRRFHRCRLRIECDALMVRLQRHFRGHIIHFFVLLLSDLKVIAELVGYLVDFDLANFVFCEV